MSIRSLLMLGATAALLGIAPATAQQFVNHCAAGVVPSEPILEVIESVEWVVIL